MATKPGEDAAKGGEVCRSPDHPDIPASRSRLGFMKGKFTVPDDFDTMFAEEIEEIFYGGDIEPRRKGEDSRSREEPATEG